jgi:hypothetical protein
MFLLSSRRGQVPSLVPALSLVPPTFGVEEQRAPVGGKKK